MFQIFDEFERVVAECGTRAGADRVVAAMKQRGRVAIGVVESFEAPPRPLDSGELDSFVNMKEESSVCT